ncbi:MAG: biliverdin-producing heme oxygenase [Myxococcota bacterium]
MRSARGNTPTASPGLMGYLKFMTRIEHARTERTSVGQALMRGRLSIRARALQLWCYAMVLEALEEAIEEGGLATYGRVWEPSMEKRSALDRDLGELASELRSIPAPVASAAAEVGRRLMLDRSSPARLLGWLYVFEGSTLGAEFLAERMSASDGRGMNYYRVYGSKTRVQWEAFVVRMCRWVPITVAGQVVAGAISAFTGVRVLFDAIDRSVAVQRLDAEGSADPLELTADG